MGPPKIISEADQGAFSCIPGGFFIMPHLKLGLYEKILKVDQGALCSIPGNCILYYWDLIWNIGPHDKVLKAYQGALCIPGGLIHSSISGYPKWSMVPPEKNFKSWPGSICANQGASCLKHKIYPLLIKKTIYIYIWCCLFGIEWMLEVSYFMANAI